MCVRVKVGCMLPADIFGLLKASAEIRGEFFRMNSRVNFAVDF